MPSPSCTVRAGAQRQSPWAQGQLGIPRLARGADLESCGLIRALDRLLRDVEDGGDRAQVAKLGNAHCVIETITDLMPCIDDIEMRLRRGQQPGPQLRPGLLPGIL